MQIRDEADGGAHVSSAEKRCLLPDNRHASVPGAPPAGHDAPEESA
jgi:hypothetical protein